MSHVKVTTLAFDSELISEIASVSYYRVGFRVLVAILFSFMVLWIPAFEVCPISGALRLTITSSLPAD